MTMLEDGMLDESEIPPEVLAASQRGEPFEATVSGDARPEFKVGGNARPPKKWAEVVQSDAFKSLQPDQQESARQQYFRDVVAPRVPKEELERVRGQFDADTRIVAPKPVAPIEALKAPQTSAAEAFTHGEFDTGASPQPERISLRGSVMDGRVAPPAQPGVAEDVNPAFERALRYMRPEVREKIASEQSPRGMTARRLVDSWKSALPEQRKLLGLREDLYQEAIGAGATPEAAEAWTKRVILGGEDKAAGWAASNFDFDTAAEYRNRNPVQRGAAKARRGMAQSALGVAEFAADVVGIEVPNVRAASERMARETQAIGEGKGDFNRNLEGAIQSIITQAPGLAVGILSGGSAVPLLTMGATTFGAEYTQGKQAGLSPQDATARASILSTAEIVGEKLGMPSFLKSAKAVLEGVPARELVPMLTQHILREIPGEQLTTLIQFTTDKAAPFGLNPEATLQDYIQQANDTLVQTVMQAGMMSGTALGVSAIRQKSDKDKAEQSAEEARGAALEKWQSLNFANRTPVTDPAVIAQLEGQNEAQPPAQPTPEVSPAPAGLQPEASPGPAESAGLSDTVPAPAPQQAGAAQTEVTFPTQAAAWQAIQSQGLAGAQVRPTPEGFAVIPQTAETQTPQDNPNENKADRPAAQPQVPSVAPVDQAARPQNVPQAPVPQQSAQRESVSGAQGSGGVAAGVGTPIAQVGRTPKNTEPLTLRPTENGMALFQGDFPVLDYDSAEPVVFTKGETPAQVLDFIKANKRDLFGTSFKIFEQGPAASESSSPAKAPRSPVIAPDSPAPVFNDFTTSKGEIKTFKTEHAAKVFKQSKSNKVPKGYVPRETPDGWVLSKQQKARTAKQLANDKRLSRLRTEVDPSQDSLWAAIAKLGGINLEAIQSEWGTDRKDFSRIQPVFGKPVIRTKPGEGMSLSAMAEKIAELGYIETDADGKFDLTAFEEAFGNGDSHYTPQEFMNLAERNAALQAEAEERNLPPEAAEAVQENEDAEPVTALDIADTLADDNYFGVETSEADFLRAMGLTEDEINAEINNREGQADGGETAARAENPDTEGRIQGGEDRQAEARQAGVDRSSRPGRGRRSEDMTREELIQDRLTSKVVPLPNLTAFDEDEQDGKAQVYGYSDGDNFKAVNSLLGHNEADKVLRVMGEIFAQAAQQTGAKAYHRSGDEFQFRFDSQEQANEFDRVSQAIAAQTRITVTDKDGNEYVYENPGFSTGIGKDIEAAERASDVVKERRLQTGERAASGQAPRGLSRIAPEGQQDNVGTGGQQDADVRVSQAQESADQTPPDGGVSVSGERFEAGRALTKEQRKAVLKTLVDVYKAKRAPRELKGLDNNGNERYGYVHSPDLFERSDITGAMVRYYVTLPDGRIAHPTELFPDYTQSDIDAEMSRQEGEDRAAESEVKRNTADEFQFDSIQEAGRFWDQKSERSKSMSANGTPTIFGSLERATFTNGSKFVMVPETWLDRPGLVAAMEKAGWTPTRAKQPASTGAQQPTETASNNPDPRYTPKVGDLVRFRLPGLNGPMMKAGTIIGFLPDGRADVRAQEGGYHKLAPDEIIPPKSWQPPSATNPLQVAAQALRTAADTIEQALSPSLELTGETEAEIRSREATEGAAADAAERKAIADREVDLFNLQSEDRREESMAARQEAGQGGLFDSTDRVDSKGDAVENFGESLPPARRALAAKLNQELSNDDVARLPLSQIWPTAENEAIQDPFAAAVAHAARAEIKAKPRQSYKVKRWIEQVQKLRGLAGSIVGGEVTRERMAELIRTTQTGLRDWWSKVQLLEQLDRSAWSRIGDIAERPEAYRYVDGKKVASPLVMVTVDGRSQSIEGNGNVLEHLDAIRAMLDKQAPEKRMEFDIRQRRANGEIFINKKGDSEYRPLMTFKTAEEARAAIKDKYADLVAAWEGVKNRDNITERDLRTAENRPRTGKDYRNGKDVTAQQFAETFGFRGGEFGKWVAQGSGAQERQAMLNNTYDALMDLADIVGIPPKAISLNGTLGIAFGSRGTGWASAHFEPSNLVINLTKTRGAGALAHEWFHALDNYFSRLRGGERPFTGDNDLYRRENYITYKPERLMVHKDHPSHPLTAAKLRQMRESNPRSRFYAEENWIPDPKHPDGVRPEVEKKWAELVDALNNSPMAKRARTLDGKKTGEGYWSRIIEVGARSFENYVMSKMMERGYHNDFLANVIPPDLVNRNPARYPYLLPEEIAPIADAFSNLFDTIETRADEAGNVAMFSRLSSPKPAGLTVPQFNAILADTFGQKVAERLGSILEPIPTQADIADRFPNVAKAMREGDTIFGFYDPRTDKTYTILENIQKDMVKGLVLHEVGVHYGWREMLGEQKYRDTLSQLDVMVRAGNKQAVEARRTAEREAANPSQVREETLAYIVQQNPEMTFVQRIISQIKAFLFRKFGLPASFLNANDFTVLAHAAVRHATSDPVIHSAMEPAFHRAFHGTPHDFDKFTTAKMGTGEGAQAYGWGLYFAGRREVADHYRRMLTGNNSSSAPYIADPKTKKELQKFADYILARKDKLEAFIQSQSGQGVYFTPGVTKVFGLPAAMSYGLNYHSYFLGDVISRVSRGMSVSEAVADALLGKSGRLYEVELAPKEDEYLDWDKPLSKQSEKVREALRKMSVAPDESVWSQFTGEQFYNGEVRALIDFDDVTRDQAKRRMSEELRSAGIRGIRYLDGSSRNRPLKDIKREFLAELPEDAGFDEVIDLIGTGQFSPKNEAILKALAADEWLGFDYPAQAINAALGGDLASFDASQALKDAIAAAQEGGTHNYVIFDENDVEVVAMFSRTDQANAQAAAPSNVVPSSGGAAITRLSKVMREAGWEIEYVDIDLTAEKPKANIRINRDDGRFLIAKVDAQGRASFETFQRERSLRMDPATRGRRPLSPMVDDVFLGRKRFEGARSMMRDMVSYLADNASNPVPLADLKSAWAGLMSAPAQLNGPSDEVSFSRSGGKNQNTARESAFEKAGIRPDTRNMVTRWADSITDSVRSQTSGVFGFRDVLAQGLADRFHAIKAAEKSVGDIKAEDSGYVAARLSTGLPTIMRGIMLYGAPEWKDGIIQRKPDSKGLLQIFEPVKDDFDAWIGWMVGKRAERLMQEGKEHNLTKEDIAELTKITPEQQKTFAATAVEFARFKRTILDLAEGAGLLDASTRPMWDQADWIPFYRVMETGEVKGPGNRRGLSGQSANIRTLKGGASALNDPMENILLNFSHLIDASLKNHALDRTLQNLAGGDFYTKEPLKMGQAVVPLSQVKKLLIEQGVAEDVVNSMPPAALQGVAKMMSIEAPRDPEVVRVMRNGKAEYFRVKDPMLLRALTNINQGAFGPNFVMAPLRAFKKILTRGVTITPDFMARNFVRDMQSAWLISKDGFRPGIDSVRGAWKSLKEEGGMLDMMFAGGSFLGGYVNGNDPKAMAEATRAALRAKGWNAASINDFMSTVVDTPMKLLEAWERVGGAVENANREAIFEAAEKAGKSKAAAVFEAKDLMDYSMQGEWAIMRFLADSLPFFNARVQGLYKTGRAFAEGNPQAKSEIAKKFGMQVVTRGLMITAATIALLAMNDGEDWYEELEDWDRDTYWHFKIGGHHFRIPKGFEMGTIFGTLPERAYRQFTGTDEAKQGMQAAGRALFDTFAFNPIPQIARPPVEIWANKNMFTGRPIEGMADQGKLPEGRYNERTSATTRAVAKAVPGVVNATGASPKRMEHLVRGYFGELGTYGLALSDLAVRAIQGAPDRPEARIDDYPLIKSFYRDEPPRNTRWRTELWEMHKEAQDVYRAVNAYRKDGNAEMAQALIKREIVPLQRRALLDNATDTVSALTKQIDIIMRDRVMTPEQKRKRIDELTARQNQVAKQTVQRAKAIRPPAQETSRSGP